MSDKDIINHLRAELAATKFDLEQETALRVATDEACLVYRDKLAAKDALIEEARNLINAAFGEYACAASKYIPENEKALFERNFAVSARNFLAKLKEQE